MQERDSRESGHGDGMHITCIGQMNGDKKQEERTGGGRRSWGRFQGRMGYGASSRTPSRPSLVLPFPHHLSAIDHRHNFRLSIFLPGP